MVFRTKTSPSPLTSTRSNVLTWHPAVHQYARQTKKEPQNYFFIQFTYDITRKRYYKNTQMLASSSLYYVYYDIVTDEWKKIKNKK